MKALFNESDTVQTVVTLDDNDCGTKYVSLNKLPLKLLEYKQKRGPQLQAFLGAPKLKVTIFELEKEEDVFNLRETNPELFI